MLDAADRFRVDEVVFPGERAEADSGGELRFGEIGGRAAVLAPRAGRRADGLSLRQVAFPVSQARKLGAETLIVVDSARSLVAGRRAGDIVAVRDHVNLLGDNPLLGPNADEIGPRFPDMTEAYDADLRRLALATATELGISLGEGVLASVTGPNPETPAERRMLSVIGADLVGNGTIPEVIVAGHCGMRALALSVVTAAPETSGEAAVSVAEAGRAVEVATRSLGALIAAIAARL